LNQQPNNQKDMNQKGGAIQVWDMSLFVSRQTLAMAIGVGTSTLIMPAQSLGQTEQVLEYTRYVDAKSGIAITYPKAIFTKSGESTGQFTKFVSSDGLATFFLIGMPNHYKQSIYDLSAAAEQSFAEEGAQITYRRAKQDWFVLSGFVANNIFYRKTVLSDGGQIIGTFQINFPKDQKPFYYNIVERMSWSFKPR
jgi:hypothetical protein